MAPETFQDTIKKSFCNKEPLNGQGIRNPGLLRISSAIWETIRTFHQGRVVLKNPSLMMMMKPDLVSWDRLLSILGTLF